ncbi:hypothetical protein K4K55_003189 [Colletotrichum sp. SAR 10_96]|nr:hypothetical protein K4K55_003189 [Colletotrichum sp. SAR 10_96]
MHDFSIMRRLTAAPITQTYHYMIEGGLEHGLLTTGEAIVFLKIDWREPETLFYHLAEPSAETEAHPEHAHLCTAVAQYLAFSLIALSMPGERSPHGQDERRRAMDKLPTWAEDFETTLRSVPDGEMQPSESPPGYEPKAYKDVDRSPCLAERRGEDMQETGIQRSKSQRTRMNHLNHRMTSRDEMYQAGVRLREGRFAEGIPRARAVRIAKDPDAVSGF